MIISIIIASIVSAVLYRAGGQSKDPSANPKWMPVWLRHSIIRRLGCTIISFLLILFYYSSVPWWAHLISFVVMYLCMTTYWDWLFKEDNFFAHGAGIALAYMPYAIVTRSWLGFVIRVVVLSLFMGIWCLIFKNDVIEEMGRGASIQLTLLAMLW